MRPHDPHVRRHRHRPLLERLEARELLSTGASSTPISSRHESPATGRLAHVDSPNGLQGKRPPGPFLNPQVIQQVVAKLYPPGSPTGTPTPREIKRETFTARWIGQYTVGPPRFTDRSTTIHAYGVAGGSNQFLKGKFQLALFPPANPNATPTPGDPYANQVTGVASLFNQNYLQTGGAVVLDLNGAASPGSNPTHLTWTYDSNTSSGPYAAPAGFTEGAGILDIQYIPDAHPLPGTSGSGKVIVTFQGLINSSQVVSAISKAYS
jgi:hypothetical protein